uniref:glycosyltransferase family 4 protein n=1 Tax=Prevotella sp. TaxID=59823 RepID=UPI0040298D9C
MKVLFDHHLFYQLYGGASKYFVMMISHLPQNLWETTALWSINEYARTTGIIHTTKKRFNGEDSVLERINRIYTKYKIGQGDFDVLHQTDFDNYFYKELGKKPLVVTYHDSNLSTIDPHPQIVKKQEKALRRANAIIAVSQNTKKDLLNLFDVDEKKVHVIYHGIEIPDLQTVSKKRIIKEEYFLYVGRRSAYKNFKRFAYAFAQFHRINNNVKLVCTSHEFTEEEHLLFSSLSIENALIAIKATEQEMIQLYRDSIALVFPSLYEGFGMPILEAWSCKCPVILANASCFPEIAENAALYFDPYSEKEMLQRMLEVYENQTLRTRLVSLGGGRVLEFSWAKCANEHLGVYNLFR